MKSFHVTTGQVRLGFLVVLVVAVLASILAWPVRAQEEPQDTTVTESTDITGDSTFDTIIAAPSGADPTVSDPGEVYIVSGANGSVVITITGASDGDWFGYSTAVAGDLNSDGYKDIIIGAPKDGNGRAYLFYGPFRDDGPLLISATNADRFFASPDPADYDFGEAVAPVHDLTADGVPELRIRAWFIDAGGWENSHTYILNGATGQGLFRITGTFPFDPWAIVEGDADGDGDVDQDDLDIILANQGRTGPDLKAQDGDVNGDGVVDMADHNLAQTNLGMMLFGGFADFWSDCADECLENCSGSAAANADGFCGPICPSACGCAYDLAPLPDNWPDGSTDPPHEYSLAFQQVTIIVYPHGDDAAVWDIDGVELVQNLQIFDNYITFETAGFGQVLVTATYACCLGGCGTMEIPINITCSGIPNPSVDTDYDGLVNGLECELGLNWNFSDSDGDSMPDGWERQMVFDPLNPIDGDLDADFDGIPNFLEFLYGSDPWNAESGADPVHDFDADGFIDWLEEVLNSNPADPGSIPSVDFTPGDMLWVQTNNSLLTLNSEIIELCEGDCIRLHATGFADSWEVIQGRDLVVEVQPDTLDSCFSGRWCFIGAGDVIFASATPQLDGSVVLGYLMVRVLPSGQCPPPCITVTAPEYACLGDVVSLQASGATGEPGDFQWTVLEFASFVGSSVGPTVDLLIEAPGEIAVGVTKGECTGGVGFTAVEMEITEIKGLYKPDGTPQTDFQSNDSRIYSNRVYDAANPAETTWTRDKQYVDITVEVRAGDPLPANARVVWELEDPDDPSNSSPTHPTAGQVLDPNDYDGVDNDGDGVADNGDGNDNTGSVDGAAVWEEVHADYALSGGNMTAITNEISKVRLNVTDDGGDNFKVKVTLSIPGEDPCGEDDTGIMTVWKLIQLENTKMADAAVLPFGQVNSHFEKAFIFWDVQATQNVPNQDPMGEDDAAARTAVDNYVEAPLVGFFQNAEQGGWFFMASAMNYVPDSGVQSEMVVNYQTDLDSTVLAGEHPVFPSLGGLVQLPIPIPPDKEVDSIRIHNDDRSSSISFRAFIDPDRPARDRLIVRSRNYHPAEDNPNSDDHKDLPDHGFAVGSTIHLEAFTPGALFATGVSPLIDIGGTLYFQGRTVVFFSSNQLGTMVHELTHGLGMAHLCGNKDFTFAKTCVMTYNHLWIQDAAGTLIQWTAGNVGLDVCAPHIVFIRKANLENDATSPGWRILGW